MANVPPALRFVDMPQSRSRKPPTGTQGLNLCTKAVCSLFTYLEAVYSRSKSCVSVELDRRLGPEHLSSPASQATDRALCGCARHE